jgi:hypothetical protein
MRLPNMIDLFCLKLSRDLALGVPLVEREEMILDIAHIAWAMSDTTWVSGRAWS